MATVDGWLPHGPRIACLYSSLVWRTPVFKSRIPAWRRRSVPLQWVVTAIAALAVAVSALFGGMSPAHASSTTPHVSVDKLIAGTPWNVTVVDAALLASQNGLETAKTGNRWFAVVAKVEVTTTDSRNDMSDILRVQGVTGVSDGKPDRIIIVGDVTDVGWLNPGMPEEVAFLWEQPDNAPVPTSAEVDVFNKPLTTDSLTGELEYGEPQLVATVRATVLDKRS